MFDALSTFFLVCFLFGAVLSALSLLSGAAHLPLPGAHALHFGHALHLPGPAHGNAPTRGDMPSINFGSVLAFLAWFGGIAFLLHALSSLALIVVLLLSLLSGLGGAALLALFLIRVLVPAQTIMEPAQYRLDGTTGRITAAIPAGGTGEITYSKAGTRRSDGARSIDGQAIPHGEEVVIVAYERGIAYVQPLQRYLTSSAAEIAARLAALQHERTDRTA